MARWKRMPPELVLQVMAAAVPVWVRGPPMQLDAAATCLEGTVAERAGARGVAVEP